VIAQRDARNAGDSESDSADKAALQPFNSSWRKSIWAGAHLGDISVVFLWGSAANVLLYLFLAIVARTLTPAGYGLFASLMGLVVLLGFGLYAVQTTFATSTASLSRGQAARFAARGRLRMIFWAATLFVAFALLSPAISKFLHVHGIGSPIAVGLFAALLVPWSALLGVFQGTSRFGTFGALTFLQAATRLLAAVTLLFTRDVAILFAAAAISVLPAIAVATKLLGKPDTIGPSLKESPSDLVATLPIASFLMALLTAVAVGFPTVGDVIVVRHVYSPTEAGLYAGMALVGRVVLFLAVAVNAVLYPKYLAMQDFASRVRLLRRGVMVTGAATGLAALALGLVPSISLRLIVGTGYQQASTLVPLYVLAALTFSVASVYAFFELALRNTRYLGGVLLTHLLLLIAAPFVLHFSLHWLVIGTLGIALSLLFWSEVAVRISLRMRTERTPQ
jgi:O-antigen/teichoic acid export membrane protein